MYDLFYKGYKIYKARENLDKNTIIKCVTPLTEKNKLVMEYMTQSIKKYIKKIENMYSNDACKIKSQINNDLSISRKTRLSAPFIFVLGISFFNGLHLVKYFMKGL